MTMRRALLGLVMLLGTGAMAADKPGCKDHPLFPTRMPDYELSRCETQEYGFYEFFTDKEKRHREEGRYTQLTYRLVEGKAQQSALAIVRNYEAAMKQAGATIVGLDTNRWVTGKFDVDGKEVWALAERGNSQIWLRIVEKQAMTQHVVADAKALGTGLAARGHVTVEGIFFDTGKAVLKPESTPALEQVAGLLKGDAALKLFVVGHTDTQGTLEDNLKLSQARAEAVMAALVKAHGIDAGRLQARGVGPLAPVASNDAEEGRAKNRRVELAKQ